MPSLLLSLLLLVPCPPSPAHAAEGIVPLAKEFSRVAGEAGIRRVGIIPFLTLEATLEPKGRLLAQALAGHMSAKDGPEILSTEKVEAVSASLGLTSRELLSPAHLSMLARELDCQGIVTGSWSSFGGQAEMKLRLYHVGSGLVLAERSGRLKADWIARQEDPFPYDPALTVSAMHDAPRDRSDRSAEGGRSVVIAPDELRRLQDAVASVDCVRAPAMIRRLEGSVLGLKARYWADKVRDAHLSKDEALRRSSDILADEEMRERYSALFKEALANDSQPISPMDVKRFITYDRLAYELKDRCIR